MARRDGWLTTTRRRIKWVLCRISPSLLFRLRFRRHKGRWANLSDPRTFDEKLAFLMLYWPHHLKVLCSDKYGLRTYVQEKKLGHLQPELLGVYQNGGEVDFAALPERFVLKCTHGWGFNIFCRDKRQLNVSKTRRQLDAWLRTDFSSVFGEIHYAPIKPRVICEPFLTGAEGRLPVDYKLYCFAGKVNCVMVCLDRGENGEGARHFFYDRNWEHRLPFDDSTAHEERVLPGIETYFEMIEAAEILSQPFPFVRVDFYSIVGRPVIGEMTFSPCACVDMDLTVRAQTKLGEWITLPPSDSQEQKGAKKEAAR